MTTAHRRRLGVCIGVGLSLALGCVTVSPVVAAAEDFDGLNRALVDDYLLPRYERLAVAGVGIDDAVRRDCIDGRLDGGPSEQAFHDMMDAWMAVQHLRFGPSELFLRADRIQFWPDKRGVIGRRLTQLLTAADPSALEAQRFAQGTVAVQGLPALERLLFDPPAERENPFVCDLAIRIGSNLQEISTGLRADWRDGPAAHAALFRDAAEGNAHYLDAKEASLQLAKSLRAALLLMTDFKLDRPLGGSEKAAKPRRAESWRSARSLRNLQINLAAARTLYQGDGSGGFAVLLQQQPEGRRLHGEIAEGFAGVEAKLAALPSSMTAALARPGGWQELAAVRQALRDLLALVSGPFSQVLDLPIGFNSFDGD